MHTYFLTFQYMQYLHIKQIYYEIILMNIHSASAGGSRGMKDYIVEINIDNKERGENVESEKEMKEDGEPKCSEDVKRKTV